MSEQAQEIRSRRQAFAAPGSALDRVVRVLAVGLPAAVGVVVALMLISPLSPRGEVSFLLDRNKVAMAEDRMRVDDAMYRGQDDEGRPFSLVAGEAVQSSNTIPLVRMRDLTARLILSDGPAILSAPAGTYEIDEERVGIPGIVQFTAADGYNLGARNVTIDLTSRSLLGEGQVSGVIPAGNFSANAIRADLDARTIALIGNARLRMVPGKLRLPSAME